MAAPALGWKLATGVFLGEDRVVATTVARTPLGAKRLESCEEPVSNGDVIGALERLRSTGRLKGVLVCGVDARRVFTVTRRLSPEEAAKRPAELLAAQLGSPEDTL